MTQINLLENSDSDPAAPKNSGIIRQSVVYEKRKKQPGGSSKSFLERLVNKNYYDSDIDFQEYWKELKAQFAESKMLRKEISMMPFLGSVDVPFTTGRKPSPY